jgi:predicted enzyme related to lactoylglutathione lyase
MTRYLGTTTFLNVSNLEKSAAFYDGLGFERAWEMADPMPVIGYSLGAGAQLLIGPADGAQDEDTRRWLSQKPWGTGVVVMPEVDDIEDVFERAKNLGAEIEMPPTKMPWGATMCSIVDPDGYSIMFDTSWATARAGESRKSGRGSARRPGPKGSANRRTAKSGGRAGSGKSARTRASKTRRRRA